MVTKASKHSQVNTPNVTTSNQKQTTRGGGNPNLRAETPALQKTLKQSIHSAQEKQAQSPTSKPFYSISEAIYLIKKASPSTTGTGSTFDLNHSGGLDLSELKGLIDFYTTASKAKGDDYYDLSAFIQNPKLFKLIAQTTGNEKEIEQEDLMFLPPKVKAIIQKYTTSAASNILINFPNMSPKKGFEKAIQELINYADKPQNTSSKKQNTPPPVEPSQQLSIEDIQRDIEKTIADLKKRNIP
jgi:hypothetical protein